MEESDSGHDEWISEERGGPQDEMWSHDESYEEAFSFSYAKHLEDWEMAEREAADWDDRAKVEAAAEAKHEAVLAAALKWATERAEGDVELMAENHDLDAMNAQGRAATKATFDEIRKQLASSYLSDYLREALEGRY